MPTIYLVRHGQASFGTDNYDVLSDLGRRQAAVAGREVARRAPRDPVLASGSLSRQRDTAVAVGEALGVALTKVDPRWDEIDAHALVDEELGEVGASAGMSSTAFQEVLDRSLIRRMGIDDPHWRQFADRVAEGLDDLAGSLPRGRDAVVATSAAVIATISTRLIGGGPETIVSLNRVSINAAITTIAVSTRRMSLITYNEHGHLLDGLVTYR